MKTADFDYDLPPELIAQTPPPRREDARMLVLDRETGVIRHQGIGDLPDLLRPGDALVLNDTRVIPARLFGRKEGSGGRVEVLLLEEEAPGLWLAIFKTAGHPKDGARFWLGKDRILGEMLQREPGGRAHLRLTCEGSLLEALEAEGLPPLPPYIRRPKGNPEAGDEVQARDRERYQTVYAREAGSVAAPTAGLHLTHALLDAVRAKGVTTAAVTLHVGMGTFKPIASETLDGHVMHEERYEVSAAVADQLNRVRQAGGRLIPVGTTSARVLETAADERGMIQAGRGRTRLFIRPPYRFKAVDAMLTNFHLPQSTLLVMICTLAGRAQVLNAYAEAVRERYRFFSYGDCMFVK
jgi:S-adenosylmethionine:tRNA ribosyltransferase-isomerase